MNTGNFYLPDMSFPQTPGLRPSLAEHTAMLLRDGLQKGIWTGTLPSERELSIQLRVSRPTLRASLLLLEREYLSGSKPGKPRSIIASSAIPNLGSSKLVGLLTPISLHEIVPSASVWLDALRSYLTGAGYDLQIHTRRKCFVQNPGTQLQDLTSQIKAAVWVVFLGTETMQRWFAENKINCVTSGSLHNNITLPSVDIDHRATCRHAAGQFLTRGHRSVVFLRQGPLVAAGDLESERGFLEAFAREPSAIPSIAEHDGTPAGIRRTLSVILKRRSIPTGFLVARTMPTLTVASELMRKGFPIPTRAAVIARDSDPALDYFSPTIAHYKIDVGSFAKRLGKLVLRHAQGANRDSTQIKLMPTFVTGESLDSIKCSWSS